MKNNTIRVLLVVCLIFSALLNIRHSVRTVLAEKNIDKLNKELQVIKNKGLGEQAVIDYITEPKPKINESEEFLK